MKVVVTGANGKVGRAAVEALLNAGHDVTGVDLARPVFERAVEGAARYQMADLTDAGEAFAVIRGADAVVHTAAIPDPTANPAHVVFRTNLMATFNVLEAAVRFGVPRFVNISSETVPGFLFAERGFLPEYAPVDEDHPAHPQDPYALTKLFGEQLMDAAVARSDIRCISLRPSWVQNEDNYEQNLGPLVRDAALSSGNLWSYTDAYDLANAIVLAAESEPARPRGVLYRRAGHCRRSRLRRAAARALWGHDPAAAPLPPGCLRHLERQGEAPARLGSEAVLAGLPRRRRHGAGALVTRVRNTEELG
ncbi:NAD-dependent epimerase/dehydratase family protein [Cryobacterium breve]|uniref:NAD-dependent epimerase/dehydratase family protein n=1 Tax=Cryobacterium breve TaxID=1259258 RepID=UPI00248D27FF|nr:NAD(P)-dependent oxidoreductase [Cryobacterium breve]